MYLHIHAHTHTHTHTHIHTHTQAEATEEDFLASFDKKRNVTKEKKQIKEQKEEVHSRPLPPLLLLFCPLFSSFFFSLICYPSAAPCVLLLLPLLRPLV
jgi:hypothetical protein